MTSYTFMHTDEYGNTNSMSFDGEQYAFWPEVLVKFMIFLNANGFLGVEERIALLDGYEPMAWRGRTFVEAEEEKDGDSNWVWNDSEDEANW